MTGTESKREDAIVEACQRVALEGERISHVFLTAQAWSDLKAEMLRPVTWRDRVRWLIVDMLDGLRLRGLANRVDAFLWRFR